VIAGAIRTVVCSLCLVLAACGSEPAAESGSGPGAQGAGPAAALPTVETLNDAQIAARLEELRGTPLLVNFWARWCIPCIAEMPALVEVAEDFAAAGGRVVAISMDLMDVRYNLAEAQEKTPAFLRERGFDLEVWLHATGRHEALMERFALSSMGLPVTVAIDSSGEVVARHEGKASREQFDAMVRQALGPR
jgi:thiol-disulfide isomerase/thioredoxin